MQNKTEAKEGTTPFPSLKEGKMSSTLGRFSNAIFKIISYWIMGKPGNQNYRFSEVLANWKTEENHANQNYRL